MIIPGKRTPPADVSKEVTDNYIKAVNLNYKIKSSAQVAQQAVYDMCTGLKEMRDGKLYKELGYKNFEEYCEQEAGITRQQCYKYISIIENLPSDFVNPGLQIGVKKLWLLSTLSEAERAEIVENTDLESTSVRELEQQIKELKEKYAKTQKLLDEEIADNNTASTQLLKYEKRIKELESRPVDVVTVETIPDDYIARSAFEQTVNDYIEQIHQADSEYIAEKRRTYKEKVELENQLAELQKQLENSKENQPDTRSVFDAYYANAKHALNVLAIYVLDHPEYIFETRNLMEEIKGTMEADA